MNAVKKLRKERGLSQRELAELLHVHQTAVSQWETGRHNPDMQQAIELANLFDVSTDYILGRINDPTPPFKAPETFHTVPMAPPPGKEQKKEAPPTSFAEIEEAYIRMLAEEEGTTVDNLHLSDERRRQLRRVILSLLED